MTTRLNVDFMEIHDDGSLYIGSKSFFKFSEGSVLPPNAFQEVILVSPENSILRSIITSIENNIVRIQTFPETLKQSFADSSVADSENGFVRINFGVDMQSSDSSQLTTLSNH